MWSTAASWYINVLQLDLACTTEISDIMNSYLIDIEKNESQDYQNRIVANSEKKKCLKFVEIYDENLLKSMFIYICGNIVH